MVIDSFNVGSSVPKKAYKRNNWVNVDLMAFGDSGIRVCADPTSGLPFRDNAFRKIHAIHVLEHVPRPKQRSFLEELHRVLKPGGYIYIEVPNIVEVARNLIISYERKDYEKARCWTLSIYGKQRHKGDAHNWGFYPELLEAMMTEAGFKDVSEPPTPLSAHYLMEPVIYRLGVKKE